MIVILNAHAGTVASSANLQSRIADLFGAAGLNIEIISVAGKDMSAAAKRAVVENHETIVAAGGDGTVNTVAAEVAGTEKTLGVLPLGTLNHFAKDLHLSLDLEGAVRTIAEGNIASVDVGEVNGRVFVNNSSLGIYPSACRRTDAAAYWKAPGIHLGYDACLSPISFSRSPHRGGR
jgi:diacylglycerol kinase family enzyme